MEEQKPIGQIIDELFFCFTSSSVYTTLGKGKWELQMASDGSLLILRNRELNLKIRQWNYPSVFMQAVTSEEKEIWFENYVLNAKKEFSSPTRYLSGRWETVLRELNLQYHLK